MHIPDDARRILDFVSEPAVNEPRIFSVDHAIDQHLSQIYWTWRAAFDQDLHASPLQHPDAVLAELASERIRSRLSPALICDESTPNNNCFGILVPKVIRTSQVGGVGIDWNLQGLRLAGSRILGKSPTLNQQMRILQTAVDYAAKSNADFLLIEDLDESSPLFPSIYDHQTHGCLLFEAKEFQRRHFIDFPKSEDDFWETFSNHSRKLFRRDLKKCAHARLERITKIEQIPAFLDAAHDISKRTWQTQQLGLRIRNDEMELRQMTALALNGMMRNYLFLIDGKPAAFAVGNQHAGCFRYEETGFSPEFREFKPGRIMLLQMISDLLRHNPPSCFDFGFGDAEYKQHFANRQSRSGTVWLVPPTLRARISLSHLNVCRRLRSAVYTRIRNSNIGVSARQWIRSVVTPQRLAAIHETHDESKVVSETQ